MAWYSTTPGAITALVTSLKAAPGLAGVAVDDGPTVTNSSATERLTVGFTNEATPSAVEGTLAAEGLAVTPDRETYTIQCAITVVRGNTDIVGARTRAYDLLAGAGQALVLDHTLGQTVMRARIAAVTLNQSQGTTGASATIVFGVEVDAYSSR